MHKHAPKIVEFGFDLDMNWVAKLYGCLGCDYVDSMPPPDEEELAIDHNYCGPECFGCKARTLQLATGDAAGNIVASGTTQKKWDKELQLYRDAKAQGVQPAGTSTKAIRAALTASETMNKPYDAGKMPATQHITKETVAVMKEVGAI